MKAYIQPCIPHYIEYDILDSGGKKVKQINIMKEYFELSEQLIITGHHYLYTDLFSILKKLYNSSKNLKSNNISLYLEEKNKLCFIWLIKYDEKKQKRIKLFSKRFPRLEWANIEELFLKAGLIVQARYKKQIIEFKYDVLQTSYLLILENNNNMIYVESPNQDKLIEALTKIGYSLDQVEIIEH